MKVVEVRRLLDNNKLDKELMYYKSFLNLTEGDIVVINTLTGLKLALVTCSEVMDVSRKSRTRDYVVQVIDTKLYDYYTGKDAKIKEIVNVLSSKSLEEIDVILTCITKANNN